MVTHNNWLITNIKERIDNKKSNFSVDFLPYKFTHLSFQEECDITCNILTQKYSNIFIGLSGGIDSEFLCKIFYRNNAKFIPIISLYENNLKESAYAFEFCKKYNLHSIILRLTNSEIADIIQNSIVNKLNGIGFYSVGTIAAAKYAESRGDAFIEAQHIIGDSDEIIENYEYYLSEWDFYNDALSNIDIIPFFLYRLELVSSMLREIKNDFISWKKLKSQVFDCETRDKIRPIFNEKIQKLNSLFLLKHNKNSVDTTFHLGKLNDLWKKMSYDNVQKSP